MSLIYFLLIVLKKTKASSRNIIEIHSIKMVFKEHSFAIYIFIDGIFCNYHFMCKCNANFIDFSSAQRKWVEDFSVCM